MPGIAGQRPKPGRELSVKCEGFGSTQPPNPGKSDRGVKNEPERIGARKARKIKSNLDPDLKGIRLRGARHLNILSAACHTGLHHHSSEGKRAHGDWLPWLQPTTARLLSPGTTLKCLTPRPENGGDLPLLRPERRGEGLFLE